MSIKTYRYPLLFITLLLFLLLPSASSAQTKTYFWEQFDVDITLQENGDLLISETQTLLFDGAPFTFGFREIPINAYGRNDGIIFTGVREGDINYTPSSFPQDHTYNVTTDSRYTTIKWYFPPTTGLHTYTLTYTVEGAIRTEPSGDQLFWNALPSELESRILNSHITINLPAGITAQSTTALFDGRQDQGITTTTNDNTITFDLTTARPAGATVEVGARFPSGQLPLSQPNWQIEEQRQDAMQLAVLIVSALIAIGGPLLILAWWFITGRDPNTGPIPDYLATPPSRLPPAAVGTLIDEKADIHDIMSTLVDLAKRGYLTMRETNKTGSDFTFSRTNRGTEELRPYEVTLISKFFDGKTSRRLSDLKYQFAGHLSAIRSELYQELVTLKYMPRSPEGVRSTYGCLGTIIGSLGFLLFIASGAAEAEGFILTLCLPLALAANAVAAIWVGQHMPRKTKRGAIEAAQWLAFKTYLTDIEKHGDLSQAGKIFEEYLPYAIVFGLERSWIRKFSTVSTTRIPHWYHPYGYSRRRVSGPARGSRQVNAPSLEGMSGSMSGGLSSMSAGLTRMLNSTQSTLQSTRSSSSSSGGGFSGGFSGGSSGGGGGGFG